MSKSRPRSSGKALSKLPERPAGRASAPTAARKAAPRKTSAGQPPSIRAARAAERRQAIIDAALDEFIARGFAATRLDDIAKRAGVAKGTIYLHFHDKEALFQELIRTALVPVIARFKRAITGTSAVRISS